MKKFNPDRELYKIKYGKRNKIILSIFLLLVVISIGSTYALYQIRHSKRIIYTTVSDFSRDIRLSVYIDGETSKEFPSGDNYSFTGIECDNKDVTTAKWDYVNNRIELYSSKPNKCRVKFKTGSASLIGNCNSNDNLIECLSNNNKYYKNILVDETEDKNVRYIGADPNNYIYFNCDNYDNPTAETCELWRIIGVMNNTELESNSKASLVKIIRAESIGAIPWDENGKNIWPNATLQQLLNGDYLNSLNTYATSNNGVKGITASTRNLIQSVVWNLRSVNSKYVTSTPLDFYEGEKNGTLYNDRPATWNGKIALEYMSDWIFAISGSFSDSQYSRAWCFEKYPRIWTADPLYRTNCQETSWMYDPEHTVQTLSPDTQFSAGLEGLILQKYPYSFNGEVSLGQGSAHSTIEHKYPVVYLVDTIKLIDGDGSKNNPYTIK